MASTINDPTDLRAHERDAEATGLVLDAVRKQELDDVRWLMSHKQGRRVARRLLEKAGIYRTSFTGNSGTFFNEGMRNLGLFLFNDVMEVAPEQYVKLLEETKA